MSSAPAATHALHILSLLAGKVEPLPAAAIARALGLPRSTTYRLLTEMAAEGFVSHYREDGRWGVGVAAFELASGYHRQQPLQRRARPLLQRLVDTSTHNAHLAVLHGRDVLYAIEERAPGRPLLVSDVGVRLPATHTASGLAMLSALSTQQVTALFPGSAALVAHPGAPATVTALRRELVGIRQRGWAVEDGTVTAGLRSIAMPIMDGDGQPLAAVALTYPSGAVPDGADEQARLARMVRATVSAIQQRLRHSR